MNKMLVAIALLVTLCVLSGAELDPSFRINRQSVSAVRAGMDARYILFHKDQSVVTITGEEALQQALKDTSVVSVHAPKLVYPVTDSARKQTNAESVHEGAFLSTSYTGKGVLVGIIDGGFDYTHPAFRRSDGSTRIVQVWDQRDSTGNKPSSFSYGSELVGGEAVLQKKHDQRFGSHGTLVGSIAAGAKVDAIPYYGIAPDADLVFVATNYESDGVIDAVNYITSIAQARKQPVVINMSLASSNGPHDGTSLEDRAMEQYADKAVLIAAASNSGYLDQHFETVLTGKDTVKTYVTIPSGEGLIDFWGEPFQLFSVQPVVTDHAGNEIVRCKPITPKTVTYDTTIGYQNDTVRIQAAGSIRSPLNGKSTLMILISTVAGNPSGAMDIAVELSGGKGQIHGWNGMHRSFGTRGNPAFTPGNKSYTIGDGPGTSKGVITVGAWCSKNKYFNAEDSLISLGDTMVVGDIGYFSSRGPTVDNRTKPEITGPGNLVICAYSSFDTTVQKERIVSTALYENRVYPYAGEGGTSLSAPVVAGAVALMLEAVPTLTQKEILTILELTATKDASVGDVNRWGAGKVNVQKAMQYVENNILALRSVQKINAAITLERYGKKVVLTQGGSSLTSGSFALYSMQGKQIVEMTVHKDGSAIDLSAFAPGIYGYRVKSFGKEFAGKLFIPAYR